LTGIEDPFVQFADLRPEPLLLVSAGGTVRAANRRVESRLGVAARALQGRPLADFVAEPADAVADYLRACSQTADLVFAGLTWQRPDGQRQPCRAEGAACRGGPAGEALVLLALRPYEQAEAGPRESDRRRDAFLSMLAHELRNPLTPVRNAVHILQSEAADAATRAAAVEIIARQVRHLARLMDGLLEATRIVRGTVRLQRERLDLARLVRTAAGDLRPTLADAGLTLDVAAPETPVWVKGDATRLWQVLHNLLDNAARFTDPGGRVAVEVAMDAARREAVLAVRDTGVGIPADVLPGLFEVFTQDDRTLERSRGGLGLGLSVVRGLVELHGGHVEAASAGAGRGAEFIVRLPLEAELPALTEAAAEVRPAAERLRVLVIEDNRDAADTLRLLLEAQGHEVCVAYSGPAGVDLAVSWRPGVVVSDVGLPGLDGFAIAAALRRNPVTAAALLIALSGYGAPEDVRRGRAAGFDHYLIKPASAEEIQEILAGHKGLAP
jgi:signal transduction histidine kinase/CheY-like chemotaxis protein